MINGDCMSLDKETLRNIVNEIIAKRGCFHSEDDMKFSLAWKIKEKIPDAEIRMEKPFREVEGDGRNIPYYLDIFIELFGKRIGIELKYRTKELVRKVNDENYFLKSHVAIDLGRHAFCKDIERLETLLKEGELDLGYTIFVTNDPLYWSSTSRMRKNSFDGDFRINDGTTLKRVLRWNCDRKEKEWLSNKKHDPIEMSREYTIKWDDPNSIADDNFRFTILDIQK
jgi:hypothetical protein